MKRAHALGEKYNQAQNFISDVNAAILWLKENKFFERMHCLHDDDIDNTENQTDAEKSLEKVQNEIMMLKQVVSESKEKEMVNYFPEFPRKKMTKNARFTAIF